MSDTNTLSGYSAQTLVVVGVLTLVAAALLFGTMAAGATTNAAQSTDAVEVSIVDIQQNESGNASPYAGQTVTTSGTVTAVTDDGFYIQNGSGEYRGVYVNADDPASYAEGDVVNVTAPVEENFDLTRLNLASSDGSAQKTGTAAVPDPVTVDTANASQEAYEGVLLEVTNLTVTATPGEFGEWEVDDGTGAVKIDDVTAGDDTTPDEVDATIDSIVGPLFYSFSEFKIQPRAVENLTAPPSEDPGIPDDAENLTVLMYNDIQTAMSNADAMGHLVGVINERRNAHENPTVVVGGGDQIGPNSLGPFTNWTVPVDVLNTLDPAAEVIGNHDLDYGIDPVSNFSAESEFPWLLANLVQDGGQNMPGTKNYTIVERGNLSVGILGLVDDELFSKTNIDYAGNGYHLADYVDVGSEIATHLKEEEGVDVVIATAHIGVPESETLAQQTDNIDVIVTGDDEVAYEPNVVDGTAIVEAEGRAAYVGEVNLSVGNDTVVMNEDSRLISVEALDDTSGLPTNETAKSVVQEQRDKYLTQVAGKTTVELDSRFTNYDEETRWGNFITDAFRNRTGSDVAITNAGGIRGNFIIPPGNVTYDDVYTSLPFGNYLVEKRMPGHELHALLESQVESLDAQFGSAAGLQVSGVTYEYVDRPGAGTVVDDVFVNGEPLEMNATYNVTVNSFMAGWDRIANLTTVETDPTQYGTVVAEYLEERSPITPSDDDRIRRVTRTTATPGVLFPDGNNTYSYRVTATYVDDAITETFRLENETNAVLEPETVTVENGTMTVTFDGAELAPMARASDDLQLYGKYNDTVYEHQFLEYAVVNTELGVAPATDPDGDGRFEDVDGDGELTLADYQLFNKYYQSPQIQSNPGMWDFDGDGIVTIDDVLALRDEVTAS